MHVALVGVDGCFTSALTVFIDVLGTAEVLRPAFDSSIPPIRWSCPVLTDTPCKGRRTLKVSVNHVFVEEAGAAGEEVLTAVVEAATS